jgi:hypothetical protein
MFSNDLMNDIFASFAGGFALDIPTLKFSIF